MPLPIHQILSRTGRSFLVEHGGALTLVDTGWRGSEKRILRALEKVGKKPDDIEQIVITHAHGDHSGTAKRMRELTDAPIVASAEDAAVMSGKEPYAYAPRAWAR
ncbi:MAG: MBL fold metallo-hydrolase, partial [Actinomycetota bacterium]